MPTSVIRMNFSACTDGKPLNIGGSSSPGTLIHTATSNTTPGAGGIWDEIWLWVTYVDLVQAGTLKLLVGGTTNPDNYIQLPAPYKVGPQLVIAGLLLQNSLELRAFQNASLTGSLCVGGFVNRITN